MAIQTIQGGLWTPQYKALGSSALSNTIYVIDATGEVAVMVIRCPKAGNLQGFEAMIGTVTNAFDNGVRFSFQDVDLATGLQDGVVDQFVTTAGGTPAAAWWLNPGNFNATRAVAMGDLVALVIDNPTFTAADSIAISHRLYDGNYSGFPYGISATSLKNIASVPVFALRYDDGTYAFLGGEIWANSSVSSVTANTGTTPDEYGIALTPTATMRLARVACTMSVAASADYDLVVYDSSNNVLTTQSCDDDVVASTGSLVQDHLLDTKITMTAGSLYRVVIKPTTANSLTIPYAVFPSLALMDTAEGGQAWYSTGRTDAGAWTNYNNSSDGFRRPRIYLNFDGFDDGLGDGSLAVRLL